MEAEDDIPATQLVDDRVLKGVKAYVEVRSTNDNRSIAVEKELEKLGATVVPKFTNDVTHVIFKEGSNRTKTKAQKKSVHFVSVLWVDCCKQNQEHVSERMFPAVVPKQKGTPLFIAKMKKAKSMQPRDFETELANSAERVNRKRKKLEMLNRLYSCDSTPLSSPMAAVLVQDTQPRSPDSSYAMTPIRLTIPDTPPSMREKLKQLRLAKQKSGSYSDSKAGGTPDETEPEEGELQRKLFSPSGECDFSSPSDNSSVDTRDAFLSDSPADLTLEDGAATSDTSATTEVLQIAKQINRSILRKGRKSAPIFRLVPLQGSPDAGRPVSASADGSPKKACLSETVPEVLQKADEKLCKSPSDQQYTSNTRRKSMRMRRSSLLGSQVDTDTLRQEESSVVTPKTSSQICTNIPKDSKKFTKICTFQDDSDKDCSIEDEDPLLSIDTQSKGGNAANQVSVDGEIKESTQSEQPVFSTNLSSESHLDGNSDGSNSGSKQRKKRPMKKLLSLTDMCDPPSVLIEPTKCSQVVRESVVEKPSKRGRKKGTVKDQQQLTRTKKSKTEEQQECSEQKEVVEKTRGRKRRSVAQSKAITGPKKEKQLTNQQETRGAEDCNPELTSNNMLVNDTHIEEIKTEKESVNQEKMTKVQDNSTRDISHLNLSKDVSVMCSGRDSSLGLSMSTAYTDTTLPSFLHPCRRSVDEFSLSQTRGRKRKVRGDRALPTVDEKENSSQQMNSNSLRDQTMTMEQKAKKCFRPSLVMTSLHSHEQDVILSVVKKIGGFVVSETVNETTTHVICGEPRRTLNILQCLARGIWLLSKEWVLKSLEAGTWLPEEPFECHQHFPTCQVARCERQKSHLLYRQTVFKDVGNIYVSARSVPPRSKLVQLIKLCGGQVTGSVQNAQLYVGSDLLPDRLCVKTTWLLDCITQHKTLPYDLYKLDRPKRESSPVY